MKLAIVSDIHGNAVALEAVVEDFKQVAPDQVVCLGDAIQSGPQPAECVAILREKGWPTIMGNADAWLISGVWTSTSAAEEARRQDLELVRQWSFDQLSEADRAFIASFVPTLTIDLTPDAEVLCFHGSPFDFDEILAPLSPDEDYQKMLDTYEQRVFTGGHTHVQFIRHFGRRFFFNPGSVGAAISQRQDGSGKQRSNPWAEYAVLDISKRGMSLDFRRVPFDAEKLFSIYRSSGRPLAEAAIESFA